MSNFVKSVKIFRSLSLNERKPTSWTCHIARIIMTIENHANDTTITLTAPDIEDDCPYDTQISGSCTI